MQMKSLLFKWSHDNQLYASLLKPIGLFSYFFPITPLRMAMKQALFWVNIFILTPSLSFTLFLIFLLQI